MHAASGMDSCCTLLQLMHDLLMHAPVDVDASSLLL